MFMYIEILTHTIVPVTQEYFQVVTQRKNIFDNGKLNKQVLGKLNYKAKWVMSKSNF